ncbi:MAG: sigma-54 interaction domain-containing protein [Clostridiaceae bacterium]
MKMEEIATQFRIAVDTVKIAICIADNNGIVLYWNNSAEILYGISADTFVGRPMDSFFSNAILYEALKGKVIDSVEHQPREGTHIIISASPIKLNGKIIGAVSIDQDVTEYINLTKHLMQVENQVNSLKEEINKIQEDNFSKLHVITKNKRMLELLDLAERMAKTDANVLIRGESGTGKELIAHTIHTESLRHEAPFIVVDCSTIPSTLIESELFGYEAGSFTGAKQGGKLGKFELAEGGTIFLDEIGEIPYDMQSKLLRVLQEKSFYKIGGLTPVNVNARVIAATNRNLEQMILNKAFREDLYYRLNVVTITMPELKYRKDDIPILFENFIKEFSSKYKKNIMRINPDVIEVLFNHEWPGNVRELKNVTERLILLSEDGIIRLKYLPDNLIMLSEKSNPDKANNIPDGYTPETLAEAVQSAEKQAILSALKQANNNRSSAAKLLDIPRSTLYYKISELELNKDLT